MFADTHVNIADEIKKVLSTYSDFIVSREIKLKISIDSDTIITANTPLINILLSNLVSNSIKHNVESGEIIIELKEKKLKIKNTGLPISESSEKMFKKFQKGNKNYDSTGLGLAIVKKICEQYKFSISYLVKDNWHRIELEF